MDNPNSIHEGSSIYSGLDFSKNFDLVKKFLIDNTKQGNHFYIPDGRKDHLQIVHEGKKNLLCEICGKSFSHVGDLKRHILRVCKDYECESCAKTFTEVKHLKTHIRTV